jgi:hypothetical protein
MTSHPGYFFAAEIFGEIKNKKKERKVKRRKIKRRKERKVKIFEEERADRKLSLNTPHYVDGHATQEVKQGQGGLHD